MRISLSEHEGKRLYELNLSREDLDALCSGCPGSGFIAGKYDDVYFHLFDGISFSEAWRPMSDGYFLNVGVPAPSPAPGASREEWDSCAERFYKDLENAIQESGIIPIQDEIVLAGEEKILNLGYVRMSVEPLPEP